MSYLEIPGVSLYYEVVGEGPMLLCISGANGSCDLWRRFAEHLKDQYKVVLYDRRGFSRSFLNGAQNYAQRLEGDADDAARLIEHLSPSEPANVIGNSSGAIVSLKLLALHPDAVRTVVSYEPPAADLLPDLEDFKASHQDIYNTYRASGMPPAFEKFAKLTQANQDMVTRMSDPRSGPYHFSNVQYWWEREFMYYPFAKFDVDRELRTVKDKLVLVNGELSPKGPYQYRANVVLAEKLGLELMHVPGEHVGHGSHPAEFAKRLSEILKARH